MTEYKKKIAENKFGDKEKEIYELYFSKLVSSNGHLNGKIYYKNRSMK